MLVDAKKSNHQRFHDCRNTYVPHSQTDLASRIPSSHSERMEFGNTYAGARYQCVIIAHRVTWLSAPCRPDAALVPFRLDRFSRTPVDACLLRKTMRLARQYFQGGPPIEYHFVISGPSQPLYALQVKALDWGRVSMAAHLCRPIFIPFLSSFFTSSVSLRKVVHVPRFDGLGLFRPEERLLLMSEPDQHQLCLQFEAQQHPAFRPYSSLCPFLCRYFNYHSRWHNHLWPP